MGGNRQTLDQLKGIALHQHAVGKGAGIAFVGVADDIFARGLRLGHRVPFDARRKTRPAATAQP
jgi:hypothetical protein